MSNMNYPFDAHAVFALEFECAVCSQRSVFETSHAFASDKYFEALAEEARNSGWFCPSADSAGKMDVMTCYCPMCGVDGPPSVGRLDSPSDGAETSRPMTQRFQ